jgi:hypothetical protein
MAHQYFYRKYAEVLLGRAARDLKELEKMNLRFSGFSSSSLTTGYGVWFMQECIVKGVDAQNPGIIEDYTCIPLTGSPGTNLEDLRKESRGELMTFVKIFQ